MTNDETMRMRMRLRNLARLCVLLMFVVVTASAWLRLAQPRPECTDWPACRAVAAHARLAAVTPASAPGASVVRGLHRLAASTTLVLLVVLIVAAWRGRVGGVLPLLGGLLALALGLSALGIVSPGSPALPIVLGNLLGGFAMTALSWTVVRRLGPATPAPARLRRGAGVAALLWFAQAALGASSGQGVGSSVVSVLHVLLGLAAGMAALLLGLALARTASRSEGRALVALAGAQLLLGLLAGTQGAAAPVVLLHNALAALGLCLCVALAGTTPPRTSA